MELSLERYRYAALKSKTPPNGQHTPLPGGPIPENDKRLQPRLLLNLFPGSLILKNDKLHLQSVLNGWYGIPKQTWQLSFRATSHNFSAAAFHRMCDGVAPLFVIALVIENMPKLNNFILKICIYYFQGSNGEISGGFSDVAFAKTSRKGGYIHSENAFLFTLNAVNESPVKYDVVKKPYAIGYHPELV